MVVAKVALGKIKQIFKHDMTLEAPPEGYNSTHGVAKQDGVQSEFTVCVYSYLEYQLIYFKFVHSNLGSDFKITWHWRMQTNSYWKHWLQHDLCKSAYQYASLLKLRMYFKGT